MKKTKSWKFSVRLPLRPVFHVHYCTPFHVITGLFNLLRYFGAVKYSSLKFFETPLSLLPAPPPPPPPVLHIFLFYTRQIPNFPSWNLEPVAMCILFSSCFIFRGTLYCHYCAPVLSIHAVPTRSVRYRGTLQHLEAVLAIFPGISTWKIGLTSLIWSVPRCPPSHNLQIWWKLGEFPYLSVKIKLC